MKCKQSTGSNWIFVCRQTHSKDLLYIVNWLLRFYSADHHTWAPVERDDDDCGVLPRYGDVCRISTTGECIGGICRGIQWIGYRMRGMIINRQEHTFDLNASRTHPCEMYVVLLNIVKERIEGGWCSWHKVVVGYILPIWGRSEMAWNWCAVCYLVCCSCWGGCCCYRCLTMDCCYCRRARQDVLIAERCFVVIDNAGAARVFLWRKANQAISWMDGLIKF